MIENVDWCLVDWSRAQFALTAMYHWLFVPLTLGITWILAIMETIYVRTGNELWKKITKYWMTLFGVNFAIGVATGIILEFEFGTNWSSYSWFVGDIFGAPLAIEGIMAFFLESTFIAVMFFGWKKVSKKFHLLSTWLVAIGSNLSALWILVANAWMQKPVGMQFNPDTARNEMVNFGEVLFNSMAMNKFFHTITSGFVLASIFIIGISAWFIIKKKEILFARKSIYIASIFGLVSSVTLAFTGDRSARELVHAQPMKFAAIEGLYHGQEGAGLVAIGIMAQPDKEATEEEKNIKSFSLKIEIPNFLSYMAYGKFDAFVPGVRDLINGKPKYNIMSAYEKIERGKKARNILAEYKEAKNKGDQLKQNDLARLINSEDFQKNYFRYFGYAFVSDTEKLIPYVPLCFYSFHLMVGLGFYFILLCGMALFYSIKDTIETKRKFLKIALWSIPLPYIAGEAGWIVAEMGRQPWVIQDLMPSWIAVSQIEASSVQVTFWLFVVLFTSLLIAEISIMLKQIKLGPKDH